MEVRPNYDDYFFSIAKVVASRSTCPSRKVGAVLVNPITKDIISTGYNGAPRNSEHCGPECAERKSGTDWHKCKAIHAELNVIISAALNGGKTLGAWLYLTTTPCVFCARVLINAGINHVLANSAYVHEEALTLLKKSGVKVSIITGVQLPTLKFREDSKGVREEL